MASRNLLLEQHLAEEGVRLSAVNLLSGVVSPSPSPPSSNSSASFLEKFCYPRTDGGWAFSNALGAYLPCFVDIVMLGFAYAVMTLLATTRLLLLRKGVSRSPPRTLEYVPVVAAWGCVFCPLGQLLLQAPLLNIFGRLLPLYETMTRAMAVVAWSLTAVALSTQLTRARKLGAWYMRFTMLYVMAGQLAKLKFTLLFLEELPLVLRWLSLLLLLIDGACHVVIGTMALLYWPDITFADPDVSDLNGEDGQYVRLQGHDSPEPDASFLSKLLFSWVSAILALGAKRPLESSDIWNLQSSDTSLECVRKFYTAFDAESRRSKRSLLRILIAAFGDSFWAAGFFQLIGTFMQFAGPLMLAELLTSMSMGQPIAKSYTIATIVLVAMLVGAACSAHHNYAMQRFGSRMRSALINVMMRKALHLTPGGRRGFPTSRIVAMMAGDTAMLQHVCENTHLLWSTPLALILGVTMIYRLMGACAVATLVAWLLVIPLQMVVASSTVKLAGAGRDKTQSRIGLLTEMFSFMETVKCYGWERSFRSYAYNLREQELDWTRRALVADTGNLFMLEAGPVLVSVATYATYVLLGGKFNVPLLFTSWGFLNALRAPLSFFPEVALSSIGAIMCLERIQELLQAEEAQLAPWIPTRKGMPAIECHLASFSWDTLADTPTLKDISLQVQPGELVAVVGATGQGKSTLLSALLGEVPLVSSNGGPEDDTRPPVVRGKTAYVAQEAWLFHATLKANVVFGNAFDKGKYTRALRLSRLDTDLELLPLGDLTEVYERGANLSGGQKHRISIARAIYFDADVIFFDDPFSALDFRASHDLFFSCIKTALADKTRVIVTNQLQLLPHVDKVIFMEDGCIIDQGSFQELRQRHPHFQDLVKASSPVDVLDPVAEDEEESVTQKSASPPPSGKSWRKLARVWKAILVNSKQKQVDQSRSGVSTDGAVEEEPRAARGAASWEAVTKYMAAAGGVPAVTMVVVALVLTELFRVATQLWLGVWSTATSGLQALYISVFLAIQLGQVLGSLASVSFLVHSGLRAARFLHEQLLDSVLGGTMVFFASTPLGRLVARFHDDLQAVDKLLAIFLSLFLAMLATVLSTLVFVGCLNPLSLWALCPLLLLFAIMYPFFQRTARETERLEAAAWSPVCAQWSEALSGLHSLRVFRAHEKMLRINGHAVDKNARYVLLNSALHRWLQLRLNALGALMIYVVSILIIMDTAGSGASQAPQLGMVLIYAFQIVTILPLAVKFASLTENTFNAAERVLVMSSTCPQEPPAVIMDSRPPVGWPTEGTISFEGCCVRYSPRQPLVLNNVTFQVANGQRLGIVGLSGSGKSTIFNALFRLVELEAGRITLDGCDLSTFGTKDVRDALMIIPQRCVIFTGTIRFNLDPFKTHTDGELWEALRRAHLKDIIARLPLGLEEQLAQASGLLSAGQRQLLLLSRALLRRSQVLVLDEATAALDRGSDSLLQRTVRQEFRDCTVLVAAHRLHSLIDSDRILVLDNAKVAEFDEPKNLLNIPGGLFHQMVEGLGESAAAHLKMIANGDVDVMREDLNKSANLRLRSWSKAARHMRLSNSIPTPVIQDEEWDDDQVDKITTPGTSRGWSREASTGEVDDDAAEEDNEDYEEAGQQRQGAMPPLNTLEKVQEATQLLGGVLDGEGAGEISLELSRAGMAEDKWWAAFYGTVQGLAEKSKKLNVGVDASTMTPALTRLGSHSITWGVIALAQDPQPADMFARPRRPFPPPSYSSFGSEYDI